MNEELQISNFKFQIERQKRGVAIATGAVKSAIRNPQSAINKGFTFVEVLATMMLMAIVLPVVMNGITMSLSAAGYAKQQSEASMLAQGKMTELIANGEWQQAGAGGNFAPDHPEFRWTAQVSDWDGSDLMQLDVTVTWTWRYKNSERSVTLTTLVSSSLVGSGIASNTGGER